MIIKKTNIYVMDSLSFQLKNLDGISIIDAKSNRSYICIYKNKKCLYKPSIVLNEELSKIIKRHRNLKIYQNYQEIDVFKNLISLKQYFKRVTSIDQVTPTYLKKPVYDKTN